MAERLLIHNQELHLVICRICQYALSPTGVQTHFTTHHKEIHVKDRGRRLVIEISTWPDLRSEDNPPALLPMPRPPIDGIRVEDGFKCLVAGSDCRKIYTKFSSLQHHLRTVHQANRYRGTRGAPTKLQQMQKPVDCWLKVRCQRLFGTNTCPYFEVHDYHPLYTEDTTALDPAARREEFRGQLLQGLRDHEVTLRHTIQPAGKNEITPWLRRTGWIDIVQDSTRETLLKTVQSPFASLSPTCDPAVNRECILWEAIHELLLYGQKIVKYKKVGNYLRHQAATPLKGGWSYCPILPYADDQSVAQASAPWQKIFMFFQRTYRRRDEPLYLRYSFNGEQQRTWDTLQDALHTAEVNESTIESNTESETESDTSSPVPVPPLSPVSMACLDFALALLDQSSDLSEHEYPITFALAVLGLNGNIFHTPHTFPSILSGLIKGARFMILSHVLQLHEDNQAIWVRQPNLKPNTGQLLRDRMDRFMRQDVNCPFAEMMSLRTYGRSIALDTTAASRITWDESGDHISYGKVQRLSIRKFQDMPFFLVSETKRLLKQNLLFNISESELPEIPWNDLRDDFTEEKAGYNFLHQSSTPWPAGVPGTSQSWLLDRVLSLPNFAAGFLPTDHEPIRHEFIDSWIQWLCDFRSRLIVLFHLTGGQPARGTELLSIRHSNSEAGGIRNVFIEDEMVVFVTYYHKGFNITDSTKVIQRYLPREVGELYVYYLWLLRPFEIMLQKHRDGDRGVAHRNEFVWGTEPGGREWTSPRVCESLKRFSRKYVQQTLTLQIYRHLAIAISRRKLRPGGHFFEDDEDEEDVDEDSIEADLAFQAAHSPKIDAIAYARTTVQRAGETHLRRERLRDLSVMWHHFLGFESRSARHKRKASHDLEPPFNMRQRDRWRRLAQIDPSDAMTVLTKGHTFRSKQREAVDAILRRVTGAVLVIMPPGAGKSILFLLPALLAPEAMTVVIVPLIALYAEFRQQCADAGLACAVWSRDLQPAFSTILLVTPETALAPDGLFFAYLDRFHRTGQLDRIVIDEFDLILNDSSTFRPRLAQLGQLNLAQTQILALTGTLSPADEPLAIQRMFWDPQDVLIVREPTTRKNIRYAVEDIPSPDPYQIDAILARIRAIVQEAKLADQVVIIYPRDVSWVQQYAKALACEALYAEMAPRLKQAIFQRLHRGEIPVLVATSIVGRGVNIPRAGHVIHVDAPRSLAEFAQQSGRAGRDGQPSESTVLIRAPTLAAMAKKGKQGQLGLRQQGVYEYLSARCHRQVLDSQLDGNHQRTGCTPDEIPCRRCHPVHHPAIARRKSPTPDPEPPSPTTRVLIRHGQDLQTLVRRVDHANQAHRVSVAQVQDLLEEMVGDCALCFLADQPDYHHSLWSRCSHPLAQRCRDQLIQLRQRLRSKDNIPKGAVCFMCLAPQQWCRSFHGTAEMRSRQIGCQWDGIILSGWVALVVLGQADTTTLEREEAKEGGGPYEAGKADLEQRRASILGQLEERDGVRCCRIVWLWYDHYSDCFED